MKVLVFLVFGGFVLFTNAQHKEGLHMGRYESIGEKKSLSGNQFFCLSNVKDSLLFFTEEDKEKGKRYLIELDVNTFSTTRYDVLINRDSRDYYRDRIRSLVYVKDFLVAIGSQYLYKLESKGNKFKVIEQIENNYTYRKGMFLNDKVILSVMYDFHPLDQSDKHVVAVLNPYSFEIEKIVKRPDFDVKFSYAINDWFSEGAKSFVFAHSTEYKLDFFNEKLIKIDSIRSNDILVPNSVKDSVFDSFKGYSRQGIQKFLQFDRSHLTRITKVFNLTDTSILVLLKLPNDSLRLDYWVKNEGKWRKQRETIEKMWFKEGGTYKLDQVLLGELYGNMSNVVYMGDGNN